jgi:hypothetical protein
MNFHKILFTIFLIIALIKSNNGAFIPQPFLARAIVAAPIVAAPVVAAPVVAARVVVAPVVAVVPRAFRILPVVSRFKKSNNSTLSQ